MAEGASSQARSNVAVPAPVGLPAARDERLARLLGALARRAATWGWQSTYDKVRRGEAVPRWHVRMMELTAARRAGQKRQPEGADDE